MQEDDKRVQLISNAAREFVTDQIEKLDSLTLDDLAINPFLVGTLNLTTPEEIISFFVNQRFQRGVVTAFGSFLEKRVAKLFAEAAKIKDIDLKFSKKGVVCYVQMKSGPEGFTGPALDKTISTMEALKRSDEKCKTFIGFAYGTKSKLSKVWGPGLNEAVSNGVIDGILIGREFWEFVLDDKDGYKILFDICKKAGASGKHTLEGVMTLERAREKAYQRILPEFKRRYGEGPQAVKKMIEDNV